MKITIVLSILCLLSNLVWAQETVDSLNMRTGAPKVFISCDMCDQQYFKNEISFLNFVRDRRLAEINVLFRSIDTGSGGTEFTLEFTGQTNYEGINTKESFNSTPNMSESDVRKGMKEALIKGILIYLIKSPLAANIIYSVEGLENQIGADKVKDKWNLWLFNINGNFNSSGQAYSNNLSYNSNFDANRTSEQNKFQIGFFHFGNKQRYDLDDTTTIRTNTNAYGFYNTEVYSLGKHFALGYIANYFSSTIQNMKNNTTFFASAEYNVFPYAEATRRQLRFNYRIGFKYLDFYDETYLSKTNDMYYLHSLSLNFSQVEKWGNLYLAIGSFQFFDKQKFYRLSISPRVSWNVAKGLNFNLGGSFSVVNDQFYLRKEEVSDAAILLGQAQLRSDFSYYFYTGLSFSFGSIYNNVVNVRFELGEND